MTNKEIESYRNSYKVVNGIGFCRVNNDINGNPRYVVHFLAFATDEEMRNDNLSQNQLYAIAKKRANDLGFSVYRANWYGGGFVGQSYSLIDTANKIDEIVTSNNNYFCTRLCGCKGTNNIRYEKDKNKHFDRLLY